MSGHVRGPWEATANGGIKAWIEPPEDEEGFCRIAEVYDQRDVYVIAAAPELLVSLEELLNAALEEELPSEEVRRRAWNVFLAARGLGS